MPQRQSACLESLNAVPFSVSEPWAALVPAFPGTQALGCFGDAKGERALQLADGSGCPDGQDAMSPEVSLESV